VRAQKCVCGALHLLLCHRELAKSRAKRRVLSKCDDLCLFVFYVLSRHCEPALTRGNPVLRKILNDTSSGRIITNLKGGK
jgi:hypothetical protein